VVKVLLMGREVNHDKADEGGQTPLSHAAVYCYENLIGERLVRQMKK